MFNPQTYAIRIEYILNKHSYAVSHDADLIRKNPLEFMDAVLKRYESVSPEREERAADFWDKYDSYEGMSLDQFGEETAAQFVEDIKALFE